MFGSSHTEPEEVRLEPYRAPGSCRPAANISPINRPSHVVTVLGFNSEVSVSKRRRCEKPPVLSAKKQKHTHTHTLRLEPPCSGLLTGKDRQLPTSTSARFGTRSAPAAEKAGRRGRKWRTKFEAERGNDMGRKTWKDPRHTIITSQPKHDLSGACHRTADELGWCQRVNGTAVAGWRSQTGRVWFVCWASIRFWGFGTQKGQHRTASGYVCTIWSQGRLDLCSSQRELGWTWETTPRLRVRG